MMINMTLSDYESNVVRGAAEAIASSKRCEKTMVGYRRGEGRIIFILFPEERRIYFLKKIQKRFSLIFIQSSL